MIYKKEDGNENRIHRRNSRVRVRNGYASTWIILTVLLLRCILQRAPKKYSYMLWAIPAVRLLIPIPFAGIWGMLGGLPEGSLGRAFYQAAFFLSHPGEIGRLLAGDGAGGGMLGLTGNGGIWDKAVQAGGFIFSHALEVADRKSVV